MQPDIKQIFSHIPQLETERLILRRIEVSDSADMFDYAKRQEVTEYLLWTPHPDRYYTRRYLARVQGQYRAGDYYDWAVVLKETGHMIGTCGFTTIEVGHDRAEIGYVLHPDYWGQGIMPEAVRAVLAFGFYEMGLNRIEAHYMVENTRSRAVMEKCGMTFEGVLRSYMSVKGRYRDIGFCSILKSEYEAQGGGPLRRK